MKLGRSHTLYLLGTFVVSQGLFLAAEAQAQRIVRARNVGHHASSGSYRAQATSQKAPHQAPRGPATRGPATRGPAAQTGRSLSSPGFGSAANVRPGFYRNLDSPHHGGRHGVAVPVYVPVYVEPIYYTEPAYSQPAYPQPAYVEPAYPAPVYTEPPPAPAQQPQIYIVQPEPAAAPPAQAAPPPPAPEPRSTEPGEVKLSILPADSEIYLDDDYLGTGAELAALDAQMFAPGVHVLEVSHPDYRTQRLVFGVSSSDPTHVLIDLSIDRVGRRSRVK